MLGNFECHVLVYQYKHDTTSVATGCLLLIFYYRQPQIIFDVFLASRATICGECRTPTSMELDGTLRMDRGYYV